MKKLSLVIAVAAALPVLAHADVTVSGALSVGYTNDYSTTTNFTRQHAIDDFGSKIRFTGSEDLGNGLKTVFKVENGFNADGVPTASGSGSGHLGNRETYVGLSHASYGLLRMGFINDVLLETESTDNLGYGRREALGGVPLYEEGLQPGSFSFARGDNRMKNSVRWDSPSWSGLSVILLYGAGENATPGSSAQDYWGYRLGYQTPDSKWFVNVAQERLNNMVQGHHGLDTRLEAGYNGDALSVALTYGHQSMYAKTAPDINASTGANANAAWNALGINNTASHLTGDAWALYASYAIGAWKPQFVISQLKNQTIDGQAFNGGARQAAASVVYSLSKATTAELGYGIMYENAGYQSVSGHTDSKSDQTWLQLTTKF